MQKNTFFTVSGLKILQVDFNGDFVERFELTTWLSLSSPSSQCPSVV